MNQRKILNTSKTVAKICGLKGLIIKQLKVYFVSSSDPCKKCIKPPGRCILTHPRNILGPMGASHLPKVHLCNWPRDQNRQDNVTCLRILISVSHLVIWLEDIQSGWLLLYQELQQNLERSSSPTSPAPLAWKNRSQQVPTFLCSGDALKLFSSI